MSFLADLWHSDIFALTNSARILQLAMATLATVGGLSALSMGGSSAKKTQGPPINAQSPDEEKFIRYYFLAYWWGKS